MEEMNTGIKTQRLWLREAREGDLKDIHAVWSNEDVMRYWSGPPYTPSQSKSRLQQLVSAQNNGVSSFFIVLQTSEHCVYPFVIGKLGIWNLDTGEIGFMLHREYWGKGYMAEAFAALLQHLWSGSGGEVRRLTADVDPRNDASLGILRRFGFYETGYKEKTIETHLGWCDSLYLALDNPNLKGER